MIYMYKQSTYASGIPSQDKTLHYPMADQNFSPLPVIDKSNTVHMAQDVIYLEVDGFLPNWKTYGFKVEIDKPGAKVK